MLILLLLLLLFLHFLREKKTTLDFNIQVSWIRSAQRNEWESLFLQHLQEDLVWEKDPKAISCNYKFTALKIYNTYKTLK